MEGGEEQATPAAAVQSESAFFAFKMTMATTLVEIAKEIGGIQYTGAKKKVWVHIIQSGHARISVANDGQLFKDDGDSLWSLSSFGRSTSLQEEDDRKWDFSCESEIK